MKRFLCLYFVLMVLLSLASPQTRRDANDNGIVLTGDVAKTRTKRVGLPKTILNLLKKAELIPIQRYDYGRGSFKVYRMTGDVKKATGDFFKLRPKIVQHTTDKIVGKVGNADVQLLNGRTLIIRAQYKPVTKPDGTVGPARLVDRIIAYDN